MLYSVNHDRNINKLINFFSLTNLTNANTAIKKCQQLLKSIEQMEKEMAEKRLIEIPIKIEENLEKKLFTVHSNNLLEINFTEEVSWNA